MNIENKEILDEEILNEAVGGKKQQEKLKTYICQACGKKFKDKADKKWRGEPVCKHCR